MRGTFVPVVSHLQYKDLLSRGTSMLSSSDIMDELFRNLSPSTVFEALVPDTFVLWRM